MEAKTFKQVRRNHLVTLYMNELTHRVVASTGIPGDRFHLGKIIMQSLKDAPNFLMQIDGAVDHSETFGSILERSVRCAVALRNLGLTQGNVMALVAPNHIDICIPYYAALYLGITIAGIDWTLQAKGLGAAFDVMKPNIVFCQYNQLADVQKALKETKINAHIITFDKGDNVTNFSDFLEKYINDPCVEEFQPTDFDTEETIALLTSTSGTTGLPKSPAFTHMNLAISLPQFFGRRFERPTFTRLLLTLSPIHWLTTSVHLILSPILRYTRLQTSATATNEHIYDLINKYKPTGIMISPNVATSIMTVGERDKCDFSCIDFFLIGGNFVSQTCINTVKEVASRADIELGYGFSEASGRTFYWDDYMPPGCIGQPIGYLRHRLVDPDTLKDIEEPNVTGELWVKGPTVFKGYFNNPEETRKVFSEDGWLKSGDLMYRDDHFNYFYVDRLKTLLKYKNHRISSIELETVIHKHPAVYDAVVVGIPDDICGELPAACVVKRPGHNITARDIKDIVEKNLPESKHLHGGVVFVEKLPLSSTTKVDRSKVKAIVLTLKRE